MNTLLHTPTGLQDIYSEACMRKNQLSERLRRILHIYGYQEIQTPTFEYFDIFNHERGTISSRSMYKFIDRDGSTLVLRPDITPQIARAAAKYFKDERIPLRFSYIGNTFINHSDLQGRLKESTQIGAELIGAGSIDADAEMIALTVQMLQASGLEDFHIDIGHVGFFKALVSALDLDDEERDRLRGYITEKKLFGVENMLKQLHLPPEKAEILLNLPSLFGSVDVLSQARQMTDNPQALSVLDYLQDVYALIVSYGFERYITIDLGMLANYNYYTGIILRGYTYGTGDAIMKGGRYDQLIGQFGKDAPSIGFVVELDELLTALSRQKIRLPLHEQGTMILYEGEFLNLAIGMATSLRNINRTVSMIRFDPDMSLDDYIDYCKKFQFDSILFIQDEKLLKKIDIHDGSIRQMPINE
jgi:ATP phosphoribosyltransferase regulatory subunit